MYAVNGIIFENLDIALEVLLASPAGSTLEGVAR